MPRVSQLSAASALDGTEIVPLVQGGVTVQATAQDIAALGGAGGGAVDTVNGQTGTVVLTAADVGADPAGTANTAVSDHNVDPGAHPGTFQAQSGRLTAVEGMIGSVSGSLAVFDSGEGVTPIDLSGLNTDFIRGDGSISPLTNGAQRIDNTDSPFVPTVGAYDLRRSYIVCDCSGGNIVINLPAISPQADGAELIIKARAVGANTITINSDAADDIDGAASVALTTIYESLTLLACYDYLGGGNSYWSIV